MIFVISVSDLVDAARFGARHPLPPAPWHIWHLAWYISAPDAVSASGAPRPPGPRPIMPPRPPGPPPIIPPGPPGPRPGIIPPDGPPGGGAEPVPLSGLLQPARMKAPRA